MDCFPVGSNLLLHKWHLQQVLFLLPLQFSHRSHATSGQNHTLINKCKDLAIYETFSDKAWVWERCFNRSVRTELFTSHFNSLSWISLPLNGFVYSACCSSRIKITGHAVFKRRNGSEVHAPIGERRWWGKWPINASPGNSSMPRESTRSQLIVQLRETTYPNDSNYALSNAAQLAIALWI